ncbi:MAG TPA: glycosyltransferase, partial [Ignavibacteria bacterium]|nr:glycosyltransferase [Ignavibacteria bacterium]
ETLASVNPSIGVGIDINPHLIQHAEKNFPGLKFLPLDVELDSAFDEFAAAGQKFDYIICSDLIGSLDDIQSVFKRLNKVSHERTKIIVTYYNYFWNPILKLGSFLHLKMKEREQNWLYIDEIQNLLFLTDYDVYKRGSLLLFPKKIPLISTFFNSFLAKLPILKRLCLVGYVIANYKQDAVLSKEYSVTVQVPCRNEEGHIDEILERIPSLGSHTEIIFVEGNSTDNTYRKIEEVIKANPDKDIKLFRQDGKGKGNAVRKGFENANCDILMILDADMTVAPEDLTKFYDALKNEKGEFINGTRMVYQMKDKAMRPLNKLGNIFFSKMFSFLLSQRITDTLCGTKVMFRSDYQKLIDNRKYFGDFDPFGDFDLLFGAAKLNLKMVEIPIRYGERKYGDTNISRFRDGWLLLKMCFFAMRKIKFK